MTYGHAWLLAQRCAGDAECGRTAVLRHDDGKLYCWEHIPKEAMRSA